MSEMAHDLMRLKVAVKVPASSAPGVGTSHQSGGCCTQPLSPLYQVISFRIKMIRYSTHRGYTSQQSRVQDINDDFHLSEIKTSLYFPLPCSLTLYKLAEIFSQISGISRNLMEPISLS